MRYPMRGTGLEERRPLSGQSSTALRVHLLYGFGGDVAILEVASTATVPATCETGHAARFEATCGHVTF